MTTHDVIQHMQTMQRRVNDRVTKKLDPPVARRRKPMTPDKVRDERESLSRDHQEREQRAKRCLRNGGPKPGQVC